MKALLISLLLLTGCDFTFGCKITGYHLVCDGEKTATPDAAVPADAGVPLDAGRPDVSVDAGQSVDTSVPSVDASVPPVVVPPVVVEPPVVVVPPVVVPPTAANRPATSKGVGLFVVGSKVFDGNGKEFRFRGTNKTHEDNWSPGLGKTKSNATRWLVYFTETPDRVLADLQSPNIGGSLASKAVAIPGFWDGTCKSDATTFNTMVNRWVRDAAKYQSLEKNLVLNIANEWGDNEIAWRDAYVAALPKIRAAGFHGLVMVDAPGCGQSGMAIARYGAAVLAADPEKNVVFDWHIYGNVADVAGGVAKRWNEQLDLVPTATALKASGVAVVFGEFGPGRNIGPSPTMVTPQRIMDVAEANGFGWLSWSWDDNDGPNGTSTNSSFSHSYSGDYNSASDLTDFGKVVVDYWERLAVKASTL